MHLCFVCVCEDKSLIANFLSFENTTYVCTYMVSKVTTYHYVCVYFIGTSPPTIAIPSATNSAMDTSPTDSPTSDGK